MSPLGNIMGYLSILQLLEGAPKLRGRKIILYSTIITVTHAPHAAIMGDGTIDGRGGEKLLHRDASWWDLAERARTGDRKQVPRLIEADLAAEQTFPSQIPQRLIG